jgi:hypothetical protein
VLKESGVKNSDKMAHNKGFSGGVVIALVIVVIAGMYLISSHPLSIAQVNQVQGNTGGICPTQTQNFQVSVSYTDFTKQPVQQTLVGSQTINAYTQSPKPATTPSVASVTSSSTSATALTGVNCNTNYLLVSGDNSGYFVNGTYANIGTQINLATPIILSKYTAPTIQTANATISKPSSQAVIHSVTASKTVIAYLSIEAGQYTASQGAMALSFSYNSSAIQSISISGVGQTSAPVPSMTFQTSNTEDTGLIGVGAQNTQVNYAVASVSNFQYATGTGSQTGTYEIPVVITTTSSFATNEIISAQITPQTNYFSPVNGTLVSVYKNPSTGADIFTPVKDAGAIVLQTN